MEFSGKKESPHEFGKVELGLRKDDKITMWANLNFFFFKLNTLKIPSPYDEL